MRGRSCIPQSAISRIGSCARDELNRRGGVGHFFVAVPGPDPEDASAAPLIWVDGLALLEGCESGRDTGGEGCVAELSALVVVRLSGFCVSGVGFEECMRSSVGILQSGLDGRG